MVVLAMALVIGTKPSICVSNRGSTQDAEVEALGGALPLAVDEVATTATTLAVATAVAHNFMAVEGRMEVMAVIEATEGGGAAMVGISSTTALILLPNTMASTG